MLEIQTLYKKLDEIRQKEEEDPTYIPEFDSPSESVIYKYSYIDFLLNEESSFQNVKFSIFQKPEPPHTISFFSKFTFSQSNLLLYSNLIQNPSLSNASRFAPIQKQRMLPRMHHCRKLNWYILNYDHYCGLVMNPIGLHNYAIFLHLILGYWLGFSTILIHTMFKFYGSENEWLSFTSLMQIGLMWVQSGSFWYSLSILSKHW